MKNRKRAIRRHHRARLKNTRKNYWGWGYNNWRSHPHNSNCEMPKTVQGKVVQYPAQCSCTGCGNPRKHFKERTLKERSMDDVYRDMLEDLN